MFCKFDAITIIVGLTEFWSVCNWLVDLTPCVELKFWPDSRQSFLGMTLLDLFIMPLMELRAASC